ncbi:Protein of unknown function DUF3468 [Penicillium cf. griseofulvum]|uniref:Zn(2)-C6 fungal-type domain-containing protein n=1 Tax=Penicillium cf. griseofulvum TaxID=2972120 RepID=A0A9W9J2D1_9EURO|nr:Protein of unknown function DUF3468 [Penicillium cf. griseofulvum]KAJ5434793.1 Protein of unknown function DUF3468 [Penicillium cf. griseofulvum]KAJ5452626.1 Protein of unknown function DUF3468 [Penicillium cf. griseofulvum]
MPDISSNNAKVPKPRTKTFTGCWTCRDRRVKCDEEYPHCRRCQRNGWACKGYDLRLGWSKIPGRPSHRRKLRTPVPDVDYGLSSAAVTALLVELDECSGDGCGHERGPFSVFSVFSRPETHDANHVHLHSLEGVLRTQHAEDTRRISGLINSPVGDRDGELASPRPAWDGLSSTTPPSPSEFREESCTGLSKSNYRVDDISINAVAHIIHSKNPNNRLLEPNDYSRPVSNIYSNGTTIWDSMSPLTLPRAETELVHHWVVFLSGNLLLIDTPDNPCRTVFLPLALKGLDASPTESNIHLSIFHAICASSAFSLSYLHHDSRYHSIAVHHDQLALHHLRGSLQRARCLDEPTLAAVLTCVTAEGLSGRRSRWRAHVAGCLGLLENEVHGEWIRSPISARMIQSYLSLSSLCSFPVPKRLMPLLNGPSDSHHYLEQSHGITTPLIQCLDQITTLVESRTQLSIEELDQLELQIYLNFPSPSNPNAPGSIIVQHALNSFYYATIVYFRRSLRGARLNDVQDLIEKAIHELESVDALTRDNGGHPYNWAGFVIAAECERSDLQDRMLAFFARKSRHGIQNINVLSEIVQALWNRRAVAGSHVDIQWQDIAREADFDIMLV